LVQKTLSDVAIANLKTEGYYWDKLPGFGLRVGKRRKTFVVVRSGRRCFIGIYPHLSLADARRLATQSLYSNTTITRRISVRDAAEIYLDQLSTKSRTKSDYKRFLTLYMYPVIGSKDLSQVGPTDILAITDKLRKTPSEQRHAHAAMNTFFNWCVPRHISANPMAGLRAPKANHRDRILTDDELKRVWCAAGELGNFGTIVRIVILLGLRRSEPLLPMHLHDTTVTFIETKNGRNHTLPITPYMHSLLRQVRPTNGWSKYKARLDAISAVSGYVLHDLRRTTASNLKCDPWLTERILGHTPPKLQKIYNRHDFTEAMRKPLEDHQDWLLRLVGEC
jgi:hypothetical protein